MNFALSSSKKTKKRKGSQQQFGFGLNPRGNKAARPKSSGSAGAKNALAAGDDSDDSDDGGGGAGGGDVNRDIAAQQRALRERAEKAAAAREAEGGGVYDYDASFESFSSSKRQQMEEEEKKAKAKEKKGSRYIGSLLKVSEERKRVLESVHEKKIAREQQAEESKGEYAGKEKFVTKAYKRKLEERELWAKGEEAERKREEEEDVTKRGSTAITSFYGNMSRNVAMGAAAERRPAGDGYIDDGGDENGRSATVDSTDTSRKEGATYSAAEVPKGPYEPSKAKAPQTDADAASLEKERQAKRLSMLEARDAKLAAARERYFQRRERINQPLQASN